MLDSRPLVEGCANVLGLLLAAKTRIEDAS